ncbi:hypothetical protein F8S09_16670 [Deinococcus sp. SDU3-2]|uniref:Uncharacterized protein n=1 Tax=Deinococcus terrestris TaxID=2651870 RepID=A0A7X1TTA8_9DEIO|nr:DUF5819 family protein [Deinococcus terrestris]MPY68291.1 hypothetical protein [Deinococcus terrestris]
MKHFLSLAVMTVSGVWLLAHFFFTAVYVTPQNPLKVMTAGVINRYIDTVFTQAWTLFAPNPIQANTSVMVQCLHEKKESVQSPWLDIAQPLWHAHQERRWTAYDRLSRTITNPVRDYMSGPADLKYVIDACQRGDQDLCTLGEQSLTAWRKQSTELLRAPVSAFCADQAKAAGIRPYTFVNVRLHLETPPAWPERFTGKSERQQVVVGTLHTLPIAAPGFYAPAPALLAFETSLGHDRHDSQAPVISLLHRSGTSASFPRAAVSGGR